MSVDSRAHTDSPGQDPRPNPRPNPWLDNPHPTSALYPGIKHQLKHFLSRSQNVHKSIDCWPYRPYSEESRVPFFEFRGYGPPPEDVGNPGDVYLDLTLTDAPGDGQKYLLYFCGVNSFWVCANWSQVPDCVYFEFSKHPLFCRRFLSKSSTHGLGWMTGPVPAQKHGKVLMADYNMIIEDALMLRSGQQSLHVDMNEDSLKRMEKEAARRRSLWSLGAQGGRVSGPVVSSSQPPQVPPQDPAEPATPPTMAPGPPDLALQIQVRNLKRRFNGQQGHTGPQVSGKRPKLAHPDLECYFLLPEDSDEEPSQDEHEIAPPSSNRDSPSRASPRSFTLGGNPRRAGGTDSADNDSYIYEDPDTSSDIEDDPNASNSDNCRYSDGHSDDSDDKDGSADFHNSDSLFSGDESVSDTPPRAHSHFQVSSDTRLIISPVRPGRPDLDTNNAISPGGRRITVERDDWEIEGALQLCLDRQASLERELDKLRRYLQKLTAIVLKRRLEAMGAAAGLFVQRHTDPRLSSSSIVRYEGTGRKPRSSIAQTWQKHPGRLSGVASQSDHQAVVKISRSNAENLNKNRELEELLLKARRLLQSS